jgi:hypothetical protein
MSSDSSESGDDQPDADSTDAETEPQDVDEEPVELTQVDPEEIDPEDLENQEWSLDGESRGTFDFAGMTWLVEDPEDDEILNLIVGAATGEGEAGQMDGSDRMFALCDSAVVAPEITPERWRDMKSGERLGLTMRIDQMMDCPEAGENPPQAE